MELEKIQEKIFELRGHKVMLDFDLAQLYEVETKNLNLAVKRNSTRFPDDFMFRLTKAEWKILRLQIETSNNAKPQRLQIETFELWRGKYSKYPPNAFTEQGVSMLSSVLRSDKAIKINIGIMRAFVIIKKFALTNKELSKKLNELEIMYNKKFKDVYEALNYLLKKDKQIIEQKDRKPIGYK